MQFSYQFPEMTERLVLVSSGGLGLEVNPALRAASLPGADLFLSVTAEATRRAAGIAGRVLRATACAFAARPRRAGAQLRLAGRRGPSLRVSGHRAQRGRSQRPNGSRRGSSLPRAGPSRPAHLGVRGSDHPGRRTPGPRTSCCPTAPSQYSTVSRHFPHVEAPQQFVTTLEDFRAATEPMTFDAERWRGRIRLKTSG